MLDDQYLFTVTDLKQFSYCKRVVFYEKCLPHIRPRTYKMDVGRDAHASEQKRAARRTLTKYDIEGGQRVFDLSLTSPSMHLTGTLDEAIFASNGEVFPVDYKLTKRASANHYIQLTAYSMLLEEFQQVSIERGFIYLIPPRQVVEVRMTVELREQVHDLLHELEAMVEGEIMPPPCRNRNHCVACEFRRFCNDVSPCP
jgi:CRISPR-associated exonuclease Cas4